MKRLLIAFLCLAGAGVFFFLAERIRADVSVFTSGGSGGLFPQGSVTYTMTTWANGPTGAVDLSLSPQKFTLTSDASITGFVNQAASGQENQAVLWFTNSATSNCTVRVTASGYTDIGLAGARSYTCSNAAQLVLGLNKNDLGFHGQSGQAY